MGVERGLVVPQLVQVDETGVVGVGTEDVGPAAGFGPDPDDPGLVHLYELWDDQAALDAHFASDHMAAWQARSADLPIRGRDITKYLVSGTGTLP